MTTATCPECGKQSITTAIDGQPCLACEANWTDWSQSGEQAHILELAAQLPRGRFLDIGAGDGETFSNTRALAKAGWGGVLVEPAAWAFDRLVRLYEGQGDYACVSAIVTPDDKASLHTFMYSRDDHLSTVVEAEAAKWPQVPFKRVFAASVTLHELLTQLGGAVSVVSIDAEGLTGELVKAYIRSPWWQHVQVICYERELGSELSLRGAFDLVAETPNNVIYRRIA